MKTCSLRYVPNTRMPRSCAKALGLKRAITAELLEEMQATSRDALPAGGFALEAGRIGGVEPHGGHRDLGIRMDFPSEWPPRPRTVGDGRTGTRGASRLRAADLHQDRDMGVLDKDRAVLAGLFGRIFGLGSVALQAVLPGSHPSNLDLV